MLPENLDIGVSRLDIAKLEVSEQQIAIWVCLKMGYIPLMIHFFLQNDDWDAITHFLWDKFMIDAGKTVINYP